MSSSIRDAMAALSSINTAQGDTRLLRQLVRRLNARSTYAWRRGDHDGARALRAQANQVQAQLEAIPRGTTPAAGVTSHHSANPFDVMGGDWIGAFYRPWGANAGGGGGD